MAALIERVELIAKTVGDLARASAFYREVLGFEQEWEGVVESEAHALLLGVRGMRPRVARLRLGDERIELLDWPSPTGRPIPADSRSNDHWFQHVAIIVSDMAQACDRLRRHGVAHTAPQRLPDWNPNVAGIEASYFRNPDGNPLELLSFPRGKGEGKWHAQKGGLLLGIDHTAIAVADTDRSLAFYRDALGLRVAGETENYGPEQERLNNVPGARLRITTLKAAAGPGIELLEYRAPRDGRPMPVDTRANDHWHWHVQLRVPNLTAAKRVLRKAGAWFVSPGVTQLAPTAAGYRGGFMVRDPDGHAVLLVSVQGR